MTSDTELVARVIAGDERAANQLADRCSDLILGLAHGRFRLDREQAEELLQATFERLWEHDHRALRAWRGEGKITTYVTVIATRLWLRQNRGRPSGSALSEPNSEPLQEAPQLYEVARRQHQHTLRTSLQRLTTRDQLLLRLRFVDDEKPAHIARLLGLSPGAARKAIHDALRRLRNSLGDLDSPLTSKATDDEVR